MEGVCWPADYDMRAFLRDIQSGLYFSGRGKWTSNLDRALNFKLINRAVSHVEKAGLRGVELVVVSGDAPTLPHYLLEFCTRWLTRSTSGTINWLISTIAPFLGLQAARLASDLIAS